MKELLILGILILAISAKAQDKKIVTIHGNGTIEEIGYITEDGLKDSIWVRYNDYGVVIATAKFNKGCKEGTWETFNDNGNKIFEIVYENGLKKYGKRWDDAGNLIETRDY